MVYVEDEIFLMTIDTGSTVTMIDTKAFFKKFPLTRLRPHLGAFQTADGTKMKIAGEAGVRVEVGPVVMEKLRLTVTDLPVVGLLGIPSHTSRVGLNRCGPIDEQRPSASDLGG
jgi:hypothetical protein